MIRFTRRTFFGSPARLYRVGEEHSFPAETEKHLVRINHAVQIAPPETPEKGEPTGDESPPAEPGEGAESGEPAETGEGEPTGDEDPDEDPSGEGPDDEGDGSPDEAENFCVECDRQFANAAAFASHNKAKHAD